MSTTARSQQPEDCDRERPAGIGDEADNGPDDQDAAEDERVDLVTTPPADEIVSGYEFAKGQYDHVHKFSGLRLARLEKGSSITSCVFCAAPHVFVAFRLMAFRLIGILSEVPDKEIP